MPSVRPPPPDQQWLSDISAGTGATRLAASTGAFGASTPAVKTALGDVSNVTGIVSGLEQGGTGGYLGAAANAAELTSRVGAGTEVGSVAGEVAGPLVAAYSIYNFANEWQSGKTGSDALAGAEAGAAIGSVIPGVGTIIGAVVGGAIGALSSAFGGGATDPETKNWQSFIDATGGAKATPAQVAKYQNLPPGAAFNLLAGVMDIRDGRIPIVNAFGRMGESTLMNGMFNQINSAYHAGAIPVGSTPQEVFNKVVTPWLNSKGATIGPETGGLQLQTVLTSLIQSWQNGQLTPNTILTADGSKDASIPTYAGITVGKTPTAQAAAANATQMLNFGGKQPSGFTLAASIPELMLIPGSIGTGAKMADPNAPAPPMSTATQGMPDTNPNPVSDFPTTDTGGGAAPATGGTDTSSLLSSLSSGVTSFLGSPLGSLTEFGTLAGLGLEQANAQKTTNDQLAGSLTATGAPFSAAGAAELSQLTGGPQVGGPRGASIADQTTAAANLGKIATQYSTGNLTPAQQQQVADYVSQQKASAIQELSNRGITDPNSDQYKTAMQQIDNNAAELGQSLITQDTQLAQGALTAVQNTYSNLINQALSESEFGFSTQEAGVMTQIQSDTALAQSLNGLFAGIAQGIGNAFKGSPNAPGTPSRPSLPVGSSAGGGAPGGGGVASSPGGGGAGSGGSAADPTQTYDPSTGEWSSGFTPGGGSVPGTDYAPGVSAEPPPAGWVDPNADPFGNVFDNTSGAATSIDVTDPFGG